MSLTADRQTGHTLGGDISPLLPFGVLPNESTILAEDQVDDVAGLEPFPLNTITAEIPIDPDTLNIPEDLRPRSIVRVEMKDPQVEALDPDDVAAVSEWVHSLSTYVRRRKDKGVYTRLPGSAGGTYLDANGQHINGRAKKYWGDQETRERVIADIGPGAEAWLGTLPTGRALEIVEDISHVHEVQDDKGRHLGTMDEIGRLVITAAPAARGIRARYTDEAYTFVNLAEGYGGTLEGKRIASHGSGSAPGPMKGAQVIRRKNPDARDPHLWHYDINPRAIDATRELARGDMAFEGPITQRVMNLLNPLKMAVEGLKLRLTGKRPHISESEGFWEYIDRDLLQAIWSSKGVKVPEKPEVRFLKRVYRDAKDAIMFSQMLPDGPDPEFLDAIGWGHVVLRDVPTVLRAIKEAGIPLSQVDVRIVGDGFCARYIVDKRSAPSRRERVIQRVKRTLALGSLATASQNT